MLEQNSQISYPSLTQPLGNLLISAGLISDYQIQVALQDQTYNSNLLIGEILALRGWIAQETADFFAIEFPQILKQQKRKKIGFYLKQAKLLNEEQINSILQEQKTNLIRFGSIAVLKGYLKQQTLDFLSETLFKKNIDSSYIMTFAPKETFKQSNVNQKLKEQNNKKVQKKSSKDTSIHLEEDLANFQDFDPSKINWFN